MAKNSYLEKMEGYRYQAPLSHLPDVPKPEGNHEAKRVTLRMPSTFVNVRGGPGVTYRTLGQIYAVSARDVLVFPSTEKNGWIYVEKGETIGWISLQSGAVSWEEPLPDQIFKDVEITISVKMRLTQDQIDSLDASKFSFKVV